MSDFNDMSAVDLLRIVDERERRIANVMNVINSASLGELAMSKDCPIHGPVRDYAVWSLPAFKKYVTEMVTGPDGLDALGSAPFLARCIQGSASCSKCMDDDQNSQMQNAAAAFRDLKTRLADILNAPL